MLAALTDAHDADAYRRLEDAGVTHIKVMPWVIYHGWTEDLDKKIDGVKRFADEMISQFD